MRNIGLANKYCESQAKQKSSLNADEGPWADGATVLCAFHGLIELISKD